LVGVIVIVLLIALTMVGVIHLGELEGDDEYLLILLG
jgi:hypothetical protein